MYYFFAGDDYYPIGGASDHQFHHADLEVVRAKVLEDAGLYEWWEIADSYMNVVDSKAMRAEAMYRARAEAERRERPRADD